MKDRLVTLFGGGGFLGRYVAQQLLKAGARVRIAQRDPREAWYLKPLGGLGQTQFVAVDITKSESVARAIAGSEAAINLVSILKGKFQAIHVDGAANIARAAKEAEVESLVHVSAIGADPESPSRYGRSKGLGEAAVRAAFPSATILRPSIMFGREDQVVNRFAQMIKMLPVVPVIRAEAKFQPAYVADVARAVVAAVREPGRYSGHAYELGGPEVLDMGALNRRIGELTGRERRFVDVPDALAEMMARFGGWAPGAPMTWDQWLMLKRDTVVAPGAEGFDAFGIAPTPLAAVAPGWLVQYRRHGRFGGVKAA